jgi:hypothetical protein
MCPLHRTDGTQHSKPIHVSVVAPCRIYILAQLLAAVLACSIFAFVSGWGPLMPIKSYKELNISWPEAVWMWITGTCSTAAQNMGTLQAHIRMGLPSTAVADTLRAAAR